MKLDLEIARHATSQGSTKVQQQKHTISHRKDTSLSRLGVFVTVLLKKFVFFFAV